MEPKSLMEILNHHFAGGLFEYSSYDHAKALAEFKLTDKYINDYASWFQHSKVNKHDIPVEIRDKYQVWKSGKVRRVEFLNDGSISRIYIGSKYALPIYELYDLPKVKLMPKQNANIKNLK